MRYCPKLKSLDLLYGQLLEDTFLDLRVVLLQFRASVITRKREEDSRGEEGDSNDEGEGEGESDQDEDNYQCGQFNDCTFDTKEIASKQENNDSLWYLLLSEDGGLVLDYVPEPGGAKRVFKRIEMSNDMIGSVDWNEESVCYFV